MHSRVGNHPCETFPANQDQFPRRKSSLQDFSFKSGSISLLEIIPLRHFYLTRMHSTDENHPHKTFPANQDQFSRRKSSLQELFFKSGCIPPPEIIPLRHFNQNRMHSTDENHPHKAFPAIQDAFPRRKSSLPDIFSKSLTPA